MMEEERIDKEINKSTAASFRLITLPDNRVDGAVASAYRRKGSGGFRADSTWLPPTLMAPNYYILISKFEIVGFN